jgi:hypothetical protein
MIGTKNFKKGRLVAKIGMDAPRANEKDKGFCHFLDLNASKQSDGTLVTTGSLCNMTKDS